MELDHSRRRITLLGTALSTALVLSACGASTDPGGQSGSGYPEKST